MQEKRRNRHTQPIIERQPLLTFWFISFPSFSGFFYTVNHIKHFSCFNIITDFNIITKAFSTVLILVNIILSVILLSVILSISVFIILILLHSNESIAYLIISLFGGRCMIYDEIHIFI